MKANNEKFIINFIKYGPIVFVATISFVITQIFVHDEKNRFESEIKQLEKNFIQSNEKRIKEEVLRVYNQIQLEKKESELELKREIKQRVYEAHAIATKIYEQESKRVVNGKKQSKEAIFKKIKDVLSTVIYNNGRGYFFINDDKGNVLLQPLNKKLENTNIINFKDANGYELVKTIAQSVKDKTERFDSYHWYKNNESNQTYKKISFYKYFAPFNVTIGTGEYLDDFEKEIQERLLKQIRTIRYSNGGYVFVLQHDGTTLSHYKKENIGKNRINIKNSEGKYLIKDIIDFGKNYSGNYYRYSSVTKTDKRINNTDKISYIVNDEEWKWVIGAGFYMDLLNQQIEEKKRQIEIQNSQRIEEIWVVSSIFTVVFVFISFIVARFLRIKFEAYESNMQNQHNEIHKKERLILEQSKMVAIADMIDNISHQWRQPLSVISTVASGIKMQYEFKQLDSSKLPENMNEIVKETQYLSHTIDKLKNFIQNKKELKEVVLQESIEHAVAILEHTFKEKNIILKREYESQEPIKIRSISSDIEEVMLNILNNAKDATIDNQMASKWIKVNISENDSNIVISIEDNGGGISDDILPRIFEPYFSTKHKKLGKGLGLHISFVIVKENLHGDIRIKNTENGAKFYIEIPRVI